MPNRFLNLDGTQPIRENYNQITEGFDGVEAELNEAVGVSEVIQAEVTDHKESVAAHAAEHITYDGTVAGAVNMKAAVDNLQEQFDTAVVSGDSSPAADQARVSSTGTTYPSLKSRLDTERTELSEQLADTDRKLTGIYNVKTFLCDDGMYVQGDGHHDDTTGIQRALDTVIGTLEFPEGNYKVTGNGEACLYVAKKVNIQGVDANFAKIRADFAGVNTSVLKIAINENSGFTDVRNLFIRDIGIVHNGGGKHAILIKDGFQILTSEISGNLLGGNYANDGYDIYIQDNFAQSKIRLNTFSSGIYMQCYDANVVEKNTFFGTRVAVTYDLIYGVRNNTVKDNVIVNRDGAVHIINGDVIRIINNQIELALGQGISQSPTRSMIWVEGRNRECQNIIIEDNNLGGGTSLDYLVYIDNAYKTIITKNNMISTNIAEVLFTANSKYCMFLQDNNIVSEISNPRTRTFMKANVVDNGRGNVGVLKAPATLNLQNGWSIDSGFGYYKDESGLVHFTGAFNGGLTSSGTLIGTLPLGFRPIYFTAVLCATTAGAGYLGLNTNGAITVGSIPSNAGVLISSFVTATTE